jgi:parallel beta-helix repeat protein
MKSKRLVLLIVVALATIPGYLIAEQTSTADLNGDGRIDFIDISILAQKWLATCSCQAKQCGDDGCGGSCGQCGPNQMCENNQCVPETGSDLLILYVDSGADGNSCGHSWRNAYTFLQDALSDASSHNGIVEIRVAKGIYRPDQGAYVTLGDRDATFALYNKLSLLGGYAGYGENDPNIRDSELYETILSGDLLENDTVIVDPRYHDNLPSHDDNSFNVVTASNTDATVFIEGFTIIGGNATEYGEYNARNDYGGGLSNHKGSPTISNCIFLANRAINSGAGMYNIDGNPTVMNCVFELNSAGIGGGGVYDDSCNPIFNKCIFYNNYAANMGGGIRNRNYGISELKHCSFTGNRAQNGGAIYNDWHCHIPVNNCVFVGNAASNNGGGIYNERVSAPKMLGCTFSGNTAGYYGGGIFNLSNISPSYDPPRLTNSILWENTDRNQSSYQSQIYGGNTDITFSCIQNGNQLSGNVNSNPNFVVDPNNGGDGWGDDPFTLTIDESLNDDYGNAQLRCDSPCIDIGNNTPYDRLPEYDLNNRLRIVDGNNDEIPVVDMGVFEYACKGNIDAFSSITMSDIAVFCANWLEVDCGFCDGADLTGDDSVTFDDLAIIAKHWLECNGS